MRKNSNNCKTKHQEKTKGIGTKLWKRCLYYFLIGLVNFSSCSESPPPSSGDQKATYPWKLICIGEGNTAGVGLDKKPAYPAILKGLLEENKPALKVVNAGVKGETITGINQRIEWMLQQRFSAILLAMSDQDLAPEYIKDWEQSIQKIRHTNPDALIMVGIVKGERSFSAIKTFFHPLSDQYNIEVLDLHLETSNDKNDWWQENGEYLSHKGQQELANKLHLLIEELRQK